jgi:hypothetical protein
MTTGDQMPAWDLDWQALDRDRRPNTIRAYGADQVGFMAFTSAAGVDQSADVDRDLLQALQSTWRGAPAGSDRSPTGGGHASRPGV